MQVWVYKYRYWDPDRNDDTVSRDYFTLEAIRAGLGVPLIDSGQKVDFAQVDAGGRYRPHAVSTSKLED